MKSNRGVLMSLLGDVRVILGADGERNYISDSEFVVPLSLLVTLLILQNHEVMM